MGRALVRSPKLFLLDEPLSNLDAQFRINVRLELLRLHRQIKGTILYVTHDQVEAMTLGDKVVVMKQGKVRQIGKPAIIYDRPADTFVATFIGSPRMNLFRGETHAKRRTFDLSDRGFFIESGRCSIGTAGRFRGSGYPAGRYKHCSKRMAMRGICLWRGWI